MADNFLERQREDYELRKKAWQKGHRRVQVGWRNIDKPDDEAL